MCVCMQAAATEDHNAGVFLNILQEYSEMEHNLKMSVHTFTMSRIYVKVEANNADSVRILFACMYHFRPLLLPVTCIHMYTCTCIYM